MNPASRQLGAFIHDTPQMVSASAITEDLDCIMVVDLEDRDFSRLHEIQEASQ